MKKITLLETKKLHYFVVQDEYNSFKYWIVKHYKKCGNYYINQMIKGYRVYSHNTRTSKKNLEIILGGKI